MSAVEKLDNSSIFKQVGDAGLKAHTICDSKTAVRNGDEVFFAHGSLIRYYSLSKETKYKVLDTGNIDFDIEGLVLNSSGTLLAAFSTSKIVVVSVSASQFNSSDGDTVRVKSFVVGNGVYGNNAEIKELLWNSISRYDSTIVVLSSDGIIRTFDLRTSPDQPESIYEVSSFNKNKIGLAANSIENPVSMCFGPKGDLSSALSLYILNEDGDIFTIYPFMPKEIAVPRELIEGLFNESLLLSNTENARTKLSAGQQLRFVTGLWNQLPTSKKEIRGTSELCVLTNEKVNDFFIQGPFSVQPFPNALYDDYGVNITSMNFGIFNLLIVSFAKHGVIALSLDSELTMKWNIDGQIDDLNIDEEDSVPTLSAIEHINFGTNLPSNLKKDAGKLVAFAQSGSNAFKIDFSKWENFSNEAIYESHIDSITETLHTSKLEGAKVELVLQLQPKEYLQGVLHLNDGDGAKDTILVTSKRTQGCLENYQIKEQYNFKKNDTTNAIYDSLLKSPYDEIMALMKPISSIKITPQENRGTVISADDYFLGELNNASEQALKYIVEFHKLGLSMNTRLISQKKELERQLRKLHDTNEMSKTLKESIVKNKSFCTDVSERQERINKRFNDLSSKLQKSVDLPLSTKEKTWFKEVKDLTLFFNRGVKQSSEIKHQLSYISSELQTKAHSSATPDNITDNQDWDELNRIIKEGKLLLENTTKELKQNNNQFENHVKENSL